MKKKLLILFPFLIVGTTPGMGESPRSGLTLRNPFQPVALPTKATPNHEERPPLERYPLNALRLTAIVTNAAGELFASVETPEGIGFKVVRGTVVGREGATVIEISKSGIVVEEREHEQMATRAILLRPKT